MSADPYALCPCGSGKKLKFCCGAHWPEIEKIEKLYEAEQDIAALDAIERLEPKLPNHPHLMNMKIDLLGSLGRPQEALATRDALIEKHPDNALARFHRAAKFAEAGELTDALSLWYETIHQTADLVPETGVHIGRALATAALSQGEFVAGRMLVNFLAAIVPDDKALRQTAVSWMGVDQQPLLIREIPALQPAPANFRFAQEFEAARTLATKANLTASERAFTALSAKALKEPSLWRNLAALRAALADDQGAAEAYAKLADCARTEDEAIEAEATSLIYRRDLTGEVLEAVGATYEVADLDAAFERLQASPYVFALPITENPNPDGPPPRVILRVLDRPTAQASPTLTVDDIPRFYGEAYFYGRETDRPARVEVQAVGRDRLESAVGRLREVTQEALPALGDPQILGSTLSDVDVMNWRAMPPLDLNPDQTNALNLAWGRRTVLEFWPETKNRHLDGRAPREVCVDPAWHRRLGAAVLILETSFDAMLPSADFDALREKLGLPPAPVIDPTTRPDPNDMGVSLTALSRVDVSKYGNEQLLKQFDRARLHRADTATLHLGAEALKRDSIEPTAKLRVNVAMSSATVDSAASIQFNHNAQRIAVQLKQSPAPYLMAELQFRIARQEITHVERLIKTLMTKHGKEPGVAQALTVVLQRLGLLTPDGRLAGAPAEEPSLVLPGGGEEPGKLWTPESAAEGAPQSKLWVPGME